MRMLHSTSFNFERTLKMLRKNFKGMRTAYKNPIMFNDATRQLINEGVAYIFGRDMRYRPIFILDLMKIHTNLKSGRIDDTMLKTLIQKFLSYSEEKLFIKGKVESWVLIVDCKKLSHAKVKSVSFKNSRNFC